MKRSICFALIAASCAWADFTYTSTVKGGPAAASQVTKHFVKGNKMKMDSGATVTLMDFDAQTLTMLDTKAKTYRVTPFSQPLAALEKSGMGVKASVKESGVKKTIGGFNCRQVMITMTMDGQQGATAGMNMVMDIEMWVSTDVPGANELKAISQKMSERGLAAGGTNPQAQKLMADMQKQMVKIGGVPVLQITRMKMGDDERMKQMQAQMEGMRAQMEEMKKQGGAQAASAEKALAVMGGAKGSGGKYLMEMTTESSGFSSAPIAPTEFSIPAGFKKVDR